MIQQRPAFSYFLLVNAWMLVFWQGLFSLYPMDPQQGPTMLLILLVAFGTSPSLFGILFIRFTAGKEG